MTVETTIDVAALTPGRIVLLKSTCEHYQAGRRRAVIRSLTEPLGAFLERQAAAMGVTFASLVAEFKAAGADFAAACRDWQHACLPIVWFEPSVPLPTGMETFLGWADIDRVLEAEAPARN